MELCNLNMFLRINGARMYCRTPRQSNSFYSPWFGMDPPDNLNLLQPVKCVPIH